MDKPSHWVSFFNQIFNPTFGFDPYLTQFWVKITQHFYSEADTLYMARLHCYKKKVESSSNSDEKCLSSFWNFYFNNSA